MLTTLRIPHHIFRTTLTPLKDWAHSQLVLVLVAIPQCQYLSYRVCP